MAKNKVDVSSYHFGGYATKNDLKCTDGRVIRKDAFKDCDGKKVPLVWQHLHNNPENVLGHALLENRDDGVYAYCSFNESLAGKNAKTLVEHKDIEFLSIWANDLIEKSKQVLHGVIREVSLVMAGANPGALIDNLSFAHSDGSESASEDEAIIYTGIAIDALDNKEVSHEDAKDAKDSEKTIKDVFESLTEEQKTAVYAIIGEIVSDEEDTEEVEHSDKQGDDKVMKVNLFEKKEEQKIEKSNKTTLTHAQFLTIVEDAKKLGSFKQSFLAHAGTYGIDNISVLFPDAQNVTNPPDLVSRDMGWVSAFFGGAKKSRFSRIKSVSADITVETARARGYVTGAEKHDEVFALLSRTTTPTTVYKKQKLDRDDVVDITDMDVVAWLKSEMRIMLDEEIARAGLIGDGRAVDHEDKINESCVRPIYKDASLYVVRVSAAAADEPEDIEEDIVRAMADYKGRGNPVMFATPTFVADLLLQKDTTGHRIYKTKQELAAALLVSRIEEVPVMVGVSRVDTTPEPDVTYNLKAIIVNPQDYTYGADKGGEVNLFDDFDIDYNQYKYLLETRCSGALTHPKSAIIVEQAAA